MLKNILRVSVIAAAVSSAVSSSAQDDDYDYPADKQDIADYVTLMMDTTGSMQVMRTDGKSRCKKAKELLEDDLHIAIFQGKNVKIVGFDRDVYDVSGGYINTAGLDPRNGQGEAVLDDLMQKVNALNCSGGTALGDAVCGVIDEIYQANAGGSTRPVIGLYTDAGEWASDPNECGGPVPAYIGKIMNRTFTGFPMVEHKFSILAQPGGNVGYSVSGEAIIANSLEDQPVASMLHGFSVAQDEINALESLTQFTGGSFNIVADDDPCDTGCNAFSDSDDPWNGGGFGR